METRQIVLRPVTQNDLQIIYNWRNTDKYRNFVHFNTNLSSSIEEFAIEFNNDMKYRFHQFIIELKKSKKPVGLIYTHGHSHQNQYCFINMYIEEFCEKKGIGTQAFFLLLFYLFELKQMYKIYLEVFEYNQLSLSSIKSCGFSIEGVFKNHKVYKNKRYDVYRFAIYKENLASLKKFLEHYEGKFN